MYRWLINFQLKNSPVDIRAVYVGPEDNSTDVFNKIFHDATPNKLVGLQGLDGKSAIFVRYGDIAAMRIATSEEEEE